jgi:hypothetical protein
MMALEMKLRKIRPFGNEIHRNVSPQLMFLEYQLDLSLGFFVRKPLADMLLEVVILVVMFFLLKLMLLLVLS